MKIRILIIITLALLFITGCKSNQEKELTEAEAQELFATKMQEASVKIASESEMPEWLNVKLKERKHDSDTILFKIKNL